MQLIACFDEEGNEVRRASVMSELSKLHDHGQTDCHGRDGLLCIGHRGHVSNCQRGVLSSQYVHFGLDYEAPLPELEAEFAKREANIAQVVDLCEPMLVKTGVHKAFAGA
jgi:hypothetical protein